MTINNRGASLCIMCQNCTGLCNWSRDFEAVPGWCAEVDYEPNGLIKRAWVGWCPEFIADEGLAERFIKDGAKGIYHNRKTSDYGFLSPLRIATLRYHFINNYKGGRNG